MLSNELTNNHLGKFPHFTPRSSRVWLRSMVLRMQCNSEVNFSPSLSLQVQLIGQLGTGNMKLWGKSHDMLPFPRNAADAYLLHGDPSPVRYRILASSKGKSRPRCDFCHTVVIFCCRLDDGFGFECRDFTLQDSLRLIIRLYRHLYADITGSREPSRSARPHLKALSI